MHRLTPRLTFANVTSLLALVLAVSSPAWAGPAANSAASLGKQVKKAVGLSKKANKTAKAASKKADQALASPGPQGPPGAQGATGPQGPPGSQGSQGVAGSDAGSMITGNTDVSLSTVSSTSQVFAPSGVNDGLGFAQLSPNATVVFRDLAVQIATPPGTGDSRTFSVRVGSVNPAVLSCTISGTDTTCNSGTDAITALAGRTMTFRADVPAGSSPAANSETRWGFRATTP